MLNKNMTRQVYAQELIDEILEYVKNNSVNQAHKKYDIARSTINRWMGKKPKQYNKKYKRVSVKKPPSTGGKRYTIEEKEEILEYEKTHTVAETSDKYGVNRYTINIWKGWTRKNKKISHDRWYQKNKKVYYSRPEVKEARKRSYEIFKQNHPTWYSEKSKIYSFKCRFKKLAEYANRTYDRKNSENYYKLTAWDLWKIAKAQRLICPLTGDKLCAFNMSVDHIIPISKGGENIPSNIRLVDKWVNIMLQDRTDEDFFNQCRKIIAYQESI